MKGKLGRAKLWFIAAAALLLVVVAYWAYRTRYPSGGQTRVLARRDTLTASVEATGQVRAAREAKLSLQASGTVAHVYVEVGDEVATGAPLIEVESGALQRRVREAELDLQVRQLQLTRLKAGASAEDLAMARANLATAEARQKQTLDHPTPQEMTAAKAALDRGEMQLRLAQGEYDKVASMPQVGMLPQAIALQQATAEYQIARANFETTQQGPSPEALEIAQQEVAVARAQLSKLEKGPSDAEIAVTEQQVELSRSALEEARKQLADARLLAPFAGTVLSVEIGADEDVYAHNAVLRLADLHTLEVTAQIDELDVGAVAVGQPVSIRLDAFPGHTIKGTLQRLAPAATRQRGSTTYEAVVSFEPGDLNVRPDMAANLTITTQVRENVLLVPNRAIQTLGRRKVVKRLEGRAARQVEITTGLSNHTHTEVLSGLTAGDVLLVE